MSVQQPVRDLPLDQLAASSISDLQPAHASLLRMTDRHQRGLLAGWGGPPTVHSVRWILLTASTTLTEVIPVRVPPGVQYMQLGVLAQGAATVTFAVPTDATGSTLYTYSDETSGHADYTYGSVDVDSTTATEGRPLQVSSGAIWEWRTVDVTATVTNTTADEATIYEVITAPIHMGTSTEDAIQWAATHSADLDGSTMYIDCDGSEEGYLHGTGLSILAWVKHDSVTNNRTICSMGDTNAQTFLVCNTAVSTGYIENRTKTAGTLTTVVTGTTAVGTGWRHQAHVFRPNSNTNGDNANYLDGSSEGTVDSEASTADATSGLDNGTIGALRQNSTTSSYLDGHILEVAIIARPLTSGEVSEAYNSGVPVDVRTLSFGAYVTDYLVCSAYYEEAGGYYFRNLGLRPTWAVAQFVNGLVATPDITTDVP